MIEVRPQPGPQEAFLACPADIAIYGGAAFSGKTYCGLLSMAAGVNVPGYYGVVFRRTVPELTGGGSIWEESQGLYRSLGGVPRSSPTLDWRFPSGALIEFRHLFREDDVHQHQGKQYTQVFFDELTHFEEPQFWYIVGRARSTCGIRPYVRATCNPDPDSFVRRLIGWWIGDNGFPIWERSGVIRWFVRAEDGELDWGDSRAEMLERHPGKHPMSLTFIPARIDDNQIGLSKDPDYRSKLDSLPTTQRKRLRDGNWDARNSEGTLFKRQWFRVVEQHDTTVTKRVRAWDRAASEVSESNPDPDWTEGVLWHLTERNELVIADVASMRGTPGQVWDFMRATAEADPPGTTIALFQDPGSAGKSDDYTARRELLGYHIKTHPARSDKVSMAELWSPLVERGGVLVLRARWNERFFRQLEAFPSKSKDDIVDAASLGIIELGYRPRQASAVAQPKRAAPVYERAPNAKPTYSSGVAPIGRLRRPWE